MPHTAIRRGVSIIEIVVCLGVGSIMLGTCIALLHVVLNSDRQAANVARYNQSLARLSDVLRRDVHAALRADFVSGGGKSDSRLVLELPAAAVTYEIDRSALIRVEQAGAPQTDAGKSTTETTAAEKSVAGNDAAAKGASKVRHRDRYHFPPGSSIAFDRDEMSAEKLPRRDDIPPGAGPKRVRVAITWPHGLRTSSDGSRASSPIAAAQAENSRPPENSGRVFQIEATLGRDHRFEQPSLGRSP